MNILTPTIIVATFVDSLTPFINKIVNIKTIKLLRMFYYVDIEKILDDVIILEKGQIVLFENADELRQKENKSIDEIMPVTIEAVPAHKSVALPNAFLLVSRIASLLIVSIF